MRALGPVPVIRPRSAPSSRANLRIEGLACALPKLPSLIAGSVADAPAVEAGVGRDAAGGERCGCGAAGLAAVDGGCDLVSAFLDSVAPVASIIMITSP